MLTLSNRIRQSINDSKFCDLACKVPNMMNKIITYEKKL